MNYDFAVSILPLRKMGRIRAGISSLGVTTVWIRRREIKQGKYLGVERITGIRFA